MLGYAFFVLVLLTGTFVGLSLGQAVGSSPVVERNYTSSILESSQDDNSIFFPTIPSQALRRSEMPPNRGYFEWLFGGPKQTLSSESSIKSPVAPARDVSIDDEFNIPSHFGRLKKTVFSDKTRLFFAVGLEGTGHHMIHSIFLNCPRESSNFTCSKSEDLMHSFSRYERETHTKHGLMYAEDVMHSEKNTRKALHEMKKIVKRQENTLSILGLDGAVQTGMWSYPNFAGCDKSLNHPDVELIAQFAEHSGLDFRVLVLLRDAESIVKSTINRGFDFLIESRILIDNINSMIVQLGFIDPKFFVCMKYDEIVHEGFSKKQKQNFVDFFHPGLGPYINMLTEAVVRKPKNHQSQMKSRRLNQENPPDFEMIKFKVTEGKSKGKKSAIPRYDIHALQKRINYLKEVVCQNFL